MEEWRSDRTRQMMGGIKTTETKGGLTTGALFSTSRRTTLSQWFMGRRLIFQRRFHPSLGINSLLNRHSCKWAWSCGGASPVLVRVGCWYSDTTGSPSVLCKEPMSHVASDSAARLAELPGKLSQLCWDVADENPHKCSGSLDLDGYHSVQISFASCGVRFLWHKQSDLHMISQVCNEHSWLIKKGSALITERIRQVLCGRCCVHGQWQTHTEKSLRHTNIDSSKWKVLVNIIT